MFCKTSLFLYNIVRISSKLQSLKFHAVQFMVHLLAMKTMTSREDIHNKLRSYLPASLEGQPPQPLCGERVPKGANHAKLSLV